MIPAQPKEELANPLSPSLAASDVVLELPEESHFVPQPLAVSLDSVLELSKYYLPRLRANGAFWKTRTEERCFAEFDLFQPDRVPATYPVKLIDEILRGCA
jgi:hypothetical protein